MIPKPTKVKHGWRIQVMVNGQRINRTFQTEREALVFAMSQKALYHKTFSVDLETAIEMYITSRSNLLSPSTVAGYRRSVRIIPYDLLTTQISELTQYDLQSYINLLSLSVSPKTIRNVHSLIVSSIRALDPSAVFRTSMPKKRPTEAKIPTIAETQQFYEYFRGTDMELPFLLAVLLGLRESEICGLTGDSVRGHTLYVNKALVRGENGWVLKGTKTPSSDRKLRIPEIIFRLIPDVPKNQSLTGFKGTDIYSRWKVACDDLGIHYRFHDLRHLNASILIASGIPQKYITARLGHISSNMLENVYGHVMEYKNEESEKQFLEHIEQYFPFFSLQESPENGVKKPKDGDSLGFDSHIFPPKAKLPTSD